MFIIDVFFLIVFGQEWSSTAQSNVIYQALATLIGWLLCLFIVLLTINKTTTETIS